MGKTISTLYKFAPFIIVGVFLTAAPALGKPAIKFIDSVKALKVVLPDTTEPCVSRLPAWELSITEGTYSRFAPRSSHEDCRSAFNGSVRGITHEEKATLLQYVTLVDSIITADVPALDRIPWSFVLICDDTDFGVPVSDKHIILTKGLVRDMSEWMESQSRMMFMGIEILIYEKVRQLQAANPEPFEKFYRDAWGFRKITPLSIDRIMQDNGFYFTRVPPNEWVIKVGHKEYIMPALLLRDVGKGSGGTVTRVAITIDSTSKGFFPRKSKKTPIEYRELRAISKYRKRFPLSDYDFHPAELSADLLAKYLVIKYVNGRYGMAPAKVSDYSQIDVLMRYLGESKK